MTTTTNKKGNIPKTIIYKTKQAIGNRFCSINNIEHVMINDNEFAGTTNLNSFNNIHDSKVQYLGIYNNYFNRTVLIDDRKVINSELDYIWVQNNKFYYTIDLTNIEQTLLEQTNCNKYIQPIKLH